MERQSLTRRQFLSLSGVIAAGAILAACQPAAKPTEQAAAAPEAPQEQAAAATEPTQEAAAPAPADKIELKMLWRLLAANEQPAMNALWDRFEELNPNIKITPRVFAPYPEVEDKAQAWLASGEPPAIFECIAGPVMRFLASRDQLYPLEPFTDKDGYDTSDFYPAAMTLCYYRDQLFALPSMNIPTVMFYNATLFDEAGVERPPMDWNNKDWNWDKWMEVSQKLTKIDSNGKVTQYAMPSVGDTRYSMRHFGLEWFNKEILQIGYPKRFASDRDGVVSTMQLWQDFIYKHKFLPTPAESKAMGSAAPDLFLTGKMAMTLGSLQELDAYRKITEFDFGICPIPYPVNRDRWNYMYPDQWYIPKPQKHLDACWELMKFTCSEEGEQYHPVQSNTSVPPRKSVAKYYTDYILGLASDRHKYTAEEMDFCMKANEIHQSAWGHGTVEYFRYLSDALQPNWELLLTNEVTPQECADQMETQVNAIIEETTPDWIMETDVWKNA